MENGDQGDVLPGGQLGFFIKFNMDISSKFIKFYRQNLNMSEINIAFALSVRKECLNVFA